MEFAQIEGQAADAEQAGMFVEQVFNGGRVHAAMLHQIEQHTWVDAAAACAHHQTVECGKAGGDIHAAPALHRAQARPIAQMRHDHPAGEQGGFGGLQQMRDMIERQAVKPRAPHALRGDLPRQGKLRGEMGQGGVEAGVEAGYLWQFRANGRDRTDRGEVVRLMQWGQWNERL